MLKFIIFMSMLSGAEVVTAQAIPSQYEGVLAERIMQFDVVSVLHAMLGIAALLFIAWLFSMNRKAISWTTVFKGLLIQFIIAVSVMFVAPVQDFFNFTGRCFIAVLGWTKAGSEFLFGSLVDTGQLGFVFIFQILPTIIFFSAFTSLLFYFGIIQKIVWVFAWLMNRAMKLSGAESLATVANIFLGMNEAPLMVKPYIMKMNRSEIMMIMIAGMSTMAGGVLAAYIGMLGHGIPELEVAFARHLLAASAMAAPGAVVIAKILAPQTEPVEHDAAVARDKIGKHALDAISNGTLDGLKLAGSVGAILLVFYALIAGANSIISYVGEFTMLSAMLFCAGTVVGLWLYLMLETMKNRASRGSLLQKKRKSYPKYLFWILGTIFALCVANSYLKSKYFESYIVPPSVFALFTGILAGALISYALMRRNKFSQVKYYEISFGILAALFTVIASFYTFGEEINSTVANITGNRYSELSMQFILGYLFAPVIWLIGVCSQDVPLVGQLLGQKIILTEFVGYSELSNMLSAGVFSETKSAI
ncbi:MAG: hypothetical protein LBR10_02345, partial [Prevotellaceae bacterium]|nr:hypothetical protein [Prevotellaceae bacterium]